MSALSLDVNLRAISEQIQARSGKVRYIACLKKESMLRTVCAAVQQSRQHPQCGYLAGSQLILRLRLARQCFWEPFALDLRADKLARGHSIAKRRRYKPQIYVDLLKQALRLYPGNYFETDTCWSVFETKRGKGMALVKWVASLALK